MFLVCFLFCRLKIGLPSEQHSQGELIEIFLVLLVLIQNRVKIVSIPLKSYENVVFAFLRLRYDLFYHLDRRWQLLIV